MAVLRTYTKGGVLLASGTAPVNNGGICWIGGDMFACVTNTRLNLFTWDGTSGAVLKRLQSFNGSDVLGISVAMASSHLGDRPDGSHLMVTQHVIAFGSSFFVARYFDLEVQDAAAAFFTNFGLAADYGGVAHDGNHWYFGYTDNSPNALVAKRELDGTSSLVSTAISVTANPADMCNDGQYLWTLEGGFTTNKTAYQRNWNAAANATFSFTPSGTDHRGIATDGKHLLILSST